MYSVQTGEQWEMLDPMRDKMKEDNNGEKKRHL